MNRLFFAILIFILSINASAAFVAVLETAADGSAKDSVPFLDRQYLTNVLREQAVKELPAVQNYTIMTRENIQQMLPPSKALEECEGSCLVETGKNIAADYVCQARVGRFGNSLTLSAELYETAGNKLIASFNGRGSDVNELLAVIEAKSPEFFHSVKELEMFKRGKAGNSVVQETTVADSIVAPLPDPTPVNVPVVETPLAAKTEAVGENKIGESIPANVGQNAPTKEKYAKKGIRWVPLSIGAAATVTGVVLAVVGNSKAKNSSEKKYSTEAEYKKNHDDAKSGQTLRGVGIGIAIAGAVGIGLSFAF
ncbi:hypothetical protein [Fibrobacter succinogenes]|uniref:hypothetical protein n=1 Tax=Fibrobacter succinogenes TaxID=833 RepID=UPI0015684AC5|nr:hypothetical protein [Fibrobacter succinogenes]